MEYISYSVRYFSYVCTIFSKMEENLDIIELSDYFTGVSKQEIDVLVVALCESGYGTIEVDGKTFPFRTRDLLICPPGVVTGGLRRSKTCQLISIGLRYTRLLGSMSPARSIWSIMTYAKNNPVFHISATERDITRNYYNLLKMKLSTQRDFYFNEIVQTLLGCIIYEVCTVVNRTIAPGASDVNLSHKDLIFKKFVELLFNSSCKDRTVAHYAEKLCVTPKYLSEVTREICGKNALEIILDSATRSIAMDLEYSAKSIKELAAEYDFPNVSVFGKFVRNRLGMSPREYRKAGLHKNG